MAGINFGKQKHDRERARAEKRQAKAEKLAARRAKRLAGVEINSLPAHYHGVARTPANGDELMRRQPMTPTKHNICWYGPK